MPGANFLKLVVKKEFGNNCLKEVGVAARMWRFPERNIVAVLSDYSITDLSERCAEVGSFLWHRVSLYDENTAQLIAITENLTDVVNDIALHPTESQAVLACGSYDGGYYCSGNAVLWNWETRESKDLLSENRMVSGCRFEDVGQSLVLMVHAACDGEMVGVMATDGWFDPPGDCYNVYLYLKLAVDTFFPLPSLPLKNGYLSDPRLAQLVPIRPEDFGFKRLVSDANSIAIEKLNQWLTPLGLSFEQRPAISDLVWLDDKRIAVTAAKNLVEIWDVAGQQLKAWPDQLSGRQILPTGKSGKYLITTDSGVHSAKSLTYLFDAQALSLDLFLDVDNKCSFRNTTDGWIIGIGRTTGGSLGQQPQSYVISPELISSPSEDIKFGKLIQSLFMKNASSLYFLTHQKPGKMKSLDKQGASDAGGLGHYVEALFTGESLTIDFPEFEEEDVFTYSIETGNLTKAWTLTRDGAYEMPFAGGVGIEIDDEFGLSLIIAAAFAKSVPGEARISASTIERRSAATGAILWRHELQSQALDLCWISSKAVVIAALPTGIILVISTKTGDILCQQTIEFDGVQSLVLSMEVRDTHIAVGTLDGRVAILEFDG